MDIPQLQTDRLTLRGFRPAEFDFYFSMNGSAEVMRYIDAAQDRAVAFRSFCALFGHWQVRGHGMWALEARASGRLLGLAGLPDWEGSAGMEAGYALHPSAWGHGFATEACRAVVRWAHEALGARDVQSVIHPDNAASIRVAERLGARHARDHLSKGISLRVYLHPNPGEAIRG
jgi:RimJ/RimL family protein N-acetyltransferase